MLMMDYPLMVMQIQDGFQFFKDDNPANNKITVQAWIYLLGDTPSGKKCPNCLQGS